MNEKKKQKPQKKLDLQVKEAVCYAKTSVAPEEEGYFFHFVPSGDTGNWLKVWECYDYTIGVDYASPEENEILNKPPREKKK